MGNLDWNTFELLMEVASGDPVKTEDLHDVDQSVLFQKLIDKKKMLDSQQELFRNASEEEILTEYERLRRAHYDFMDCFKKAHRLYAVPPTDPSNF